jgi:hypothetical protein
MKKPRWRNKPQAKKRKPREYLSDASPFNKEMLRELLKLHVLGTRLKMPADAEIGELARILNFWRAHYQAGQTYRALNQRKRKVRDALAALKDSCAILRDDINIT